MCEQFNVRSALVAPLRLDETVIGVLMAVTHDGPRTYVARDIALIEGLARDAAYALHSQQLREERARADEKRLEHQEELRRWEDKFSRVFRTSPVPIFISRLANGLYLDVNQASERMFGWSREESIGRTSVDLGIWVHPEARQCWVATLKAKRRSEDYEAVFRARSGDLRTVLLSAEIIDLDGDECILGLVYDITDRKQAEAELHIAAAAFESQEAMMVTDANSVILRVNRAFTEITGYTAAEVVGQTPRLLKSGRYDADFYRAMWETINRTGVWQGEIWDRRKSGEVYPKWLTISAVKAANGTVTHYVGSHFDITERKQAEQRINDLAFFDQLTGLPNRTLLLDRLKQTMAASSRSGNYAALLIIDLDNFKTLNDTRGHDMGDILLKQVAQRLTACVREGDTVARLGGDEFVVVLAGLSAGEGDAATGIETVTEKILATLGQPYPLGEVPYHSTASIGVTLFKGDVATIDDLMKQADLAMYKSKAAGRNVVRFFDPALEVAVKEHAALEADLRRAIDEKQLLLHYQAQIVGENRLTGAEVLVRWQHPQRGMVSPAEFIPIAEETGLILPLGNWVLQTACSQLTVWAARPEMAHLTVAVNVSAHQFRQHDFVDQVLAVLDETGANPQRLKLELTESLLISNMEEVIEKMFALKAKGVGFSLDDFGTGYSSLSYLKRLPLDQLKIDYSFVRDVLTDPNDAAIAKTIIALAQSLGLGVIAEGVETATQRDFLAGSGCHAFQGYFFSRPLALEMFEEFAQRTGRISAEGEV
ncbi:MAG: EAL domain-containing protein [Rhodocyclaceae bacterium]|nr:MAG: EAL domain-containing protein [Rhodocyclaceae bacterium]